MEKTYMCIDLKSFYASVECHERGLDPLDTNLVVADSSRTEKTICLAVSPSLKKYGLSGRSRLYEVVQKLKQVNSDRLNKINNKKFIKKSYLDSEIINNSNYEVDYIIAKPRMSYYMKYSTKIYNIYLKYISKDDICVYSIDEVFCDITNYLKYYNLSAEELVTKMIKDVYLETGITATAGIGTNLFLAKVAMDVVAKHVDANSFGVRIARLDERKYRELLWEHKPITDIWRVGKGYSEKLKKINIYTMGDIARISINNEALLFKLFGVNAEFLIDHAWGYEPVTIKDIKNYKPETTSISSGQVLHEPYDYKKAKIIVREMSDLLCLDLIKRKCSTNKITVTIGYDTENVKTNNDFIVTLDHYGRKIPKHSHGTINLLYKTASSKVITDKVSELYDKLVNKKLTIRRLNICFCDLTLTSENKNEIIYKQVSLFDNDDANIRDEINDSKEDEKLEEVLIDIKDKFGKNAILKGMDLLDGATTIDRNREIGGHHE